MSDSPFLPGTQIQFAWDSTSLGYLKTCPRLYQYTMLEGWSSKEESVHLRFGIEYHAAMQDYDTSRASGIRHEEALHDTIRALVSRTGDWDSDHEKKNRESLVRAVVWYLDKYRDSAEEIYIKHDGTPAVELTFRFEAGGPPDHPYLLCGHLDKVVKIAGELYVKDYKTVYTFWGQRWEPDNQMTLYTLATQVVLGATVKGIIVDMVTFKTKDGWVYPEFERMVTQRTKDQLEEWNADLNFWFGQAERYASAGYWPMNDTSCGKYGGCRFRDICSKSPSVRQKFLEANFKQLPPEERWNPLKPR